MGYLAKLPLRRTPALVRSGWPGLDRLRNWHRRRARSGATRGVVSRGWTVCGIGIAGGPGPTQLKGENGLSREIAIAAYPSLGEEWLAGVGPSAELASQEGPVR